MTKSAAPAAAGLYDTDVYRWACEQAAHVRAGRFDEVDVLNAAEEIDDVGRREYDAVVSNVKIILVHMLKWDFQPAKRSRSWKKSIYANRDQVEYRLDGSPSLKAKQSEWLPKAYELARRRASRETDLDLSTIPAACPYDWDSIMTRPFVLDQTDEAS